MRNLISVMIVDDEILAIEDLLNLISWEEHGFKVVATATNGKKALELFKEIHPQVVFVDIRMPVMNGLDLSKEVLASGHLVKIILLTAYKDFEYAKQAVEIGVANYLLKHDINEQTLLKELYKVKEELENAERTRCILRRQLIKRILLGETYEENSIITKELRAMEKPENLFSLLLIKPDRPVIDDFLPPVHPVEQIKLKDLEWPEDVNFIEEVEMDGNYILLISGKKSRSQAEKREKSYQIAVQIQNYLAKQFTRSFSIILSRPTPGISSLPQVFQAALSAAKVSVFFGRGKIYNCDELPQFSKETTSCIEAKLREVSKDLHNSDLKAIQEKISGIFNGLLAARNPEALFLACRELYYLLDHYRKENGLPSLVELVNRGEMNTDRLYYTPEVAEWFLEQFTNTVGQVSTLKSGQYSKKVRQAVDYIHLHYARELTVENVAEELGISGVYLSQLLRKETGKTFLEHLTERRIKVAKDLLEKGDYKIYEVAELVGYKTSQYFSQVFRKVCGCYPIDWRRGGNKQ